MPVKGAVENVVHLDFSQRFRGDRHSADVRELR
ncbi:hypothetical protein STAFG_4386 [Streptomyces afghaniensis 772]|uniref:Uncharacterized protein n=1 Tax=Streptomyces afghaniensis 772 TaxID=1283301 RepID=S4MSI0_9ACTN|nr:hypothetical protein STAFG_4386 [Streptomyces afghaniensis 772]